MDYSGQEKFKNIILMMKKEYIDDIQLKISNLSIGYRLSKERITLLQENLNLNLCKGDLICLIGPNGCGKSTLIRSLASLQQPLNGSVTYNGLDIKKMSLSSRSDLFSIVLTDRSAVDSITVFEIVALGRYQSSSWLGTLNEKDRQKIVWAIGEVGLTGFEDRMYGTLSDGEKQRAYIAKALSSDAPVMLLDEPTAHLDIPNRVEVMTLLQRLTRELEYSVILSTHDLDLALQMADEIWLMMPNKGVYDGTPEELLHSRYLDEVFGNEILRFNPHSGNFVVVTKNKVPARAKGEGKMLEITIQAMRRLGYVFNENAIPVVSVEVEKDKWLIEHDGNTIRFISLTDTCRYLKKLV
jgi:iron complex transport system ATP-binding protein